MTLRLDRRRGGIVLFVGYLLLVVVLFRDPTRGSVALASAGAAVAFVVLPALGLASGAYAFLDRPYAGVGLFVMGNYLAFVGLTLAFGFVSVGVGVSITGFVLFVLALSSVLAGLFSLWRYLT